MNTCQNTHTCNSHHAFLRWKHAGLQQPFVLACALFVFCSDVHASQKDLFSMSLEELMLIDVQVVSRQAEPLQFAPASATVFTRDDIQRMGVRWLDELMQYVPGAFPHQRAGSAAPFWATQFRGNPNENGSGILLLIDGRRQNDAAFGTASTAWMRQSLAGFKRVEIMRGPGSALYGANATYAVVNLITDTDSTELAMAGGEMAAGEIQFVAPVYWGEWKMSVNAQHYNDDGDSRAAFDRFSQQTKTDDPQQASTLQLHVEGPRLDLFANSYTYRINNYYVLATLADDTNQSRSDLLDYGVRIHDIAWDNVDLGAVINRRESEYELLSRLTPANTPPNFTPHDYVFRSTFHSVTDTIELTLSGTINFRQRWQVGMEGYREKASADADATHDLLGLDFLGGGLRRQPYDLMPDAERSGMGIYGQWQADWSDNLTSYLGVRRDETDDVGGATSPRIAFIYSGIDNQIWKLAYVEAFRAPSLGELHLTSNPVNLGNDELKPVQSRNLELISIVQGRSSSIETSVFYSKEKDLILFRPVSPTTVQRFNVGELDIKGFEFLLRWRLAPQAEMGLMGSHIFSWNQYYADAVGVADASTVMPRDLATLTFDYRHDKWQLHMASFYVGEIEANTDPSSYWLARFRLGYQLTPGQQLSLSVSNLFDTEYDTVTDSAGLGVDENGRRVRSAPQRGRQILLGWKWDWEV